ncbi:MAG: alpha-L-rhamnosidase, partial [Myxococcota bacterium]|nr:alpha-L-rhamnosidase [Myxococcota bacterium]
GYMLNAPTGTGSTFWEGYLDDGSFGYGGSYMSTAHGWSSGPTFSMTQWVLGVAPDSPAGQAYHVAPHAGDLAHAEGSLSMAPGKVVAVSYDHPACGDFTLHVDSSTNIGSTGVVGVPKFGKSRVVQLNGTTIWDGSKFVPSPAVASADEDANFIYFRGFAPAQATFGFYPKQCP